MMKNLSLAIFLLCSFAANSQDQFILQGQVLNSQKEPLLLGDAILYTTDSTLLKYQYIEAGKFAFDPIPAGKYLLRISCLGYEDHTQLVDLDQKVDLTIVLTESTTLLEEVTVKPIEIPSSMKTAI